MNTMQAAVFVEKGKIELREVPRPVPGPGQALLKVTLTTICGTDVHILKGEYPVKPGLIVGHEPVGRIEALGPGVTGFEIGDRAIVGAITPCGQCRACLSGRGAQCSHGGGGFEALGGWRFGNTINGCQAEYVLVPDAQANLAKIPAGLEDEDVLLCPDIMSTGFSAVERGHVGIGDSVVVFAQGPIGLSRDGRCASRGSVARHRRRQRAAPARASQAHGCGRRSELQGARRRRGDQEAHRRRRRRGDRGARHSSRRSKLACAAFDPAVSCRAWASTPDT